MLDLKKLINQFLEYLEVEKNRSRQTVQNYDFYLRRFAQWAGNPSFEDEKGQGLKKNTQNYHLIALRSFLKYLAKLDIKSLSAEKIELGKIPERIDEFLEGPDLERLLLAPLRIDSAEIIQKRDNKNNQR